jgi:DNA-binding MarR family transcriptional regulator/N-acetylglutamate synthase-like GNAT family acetyltransferase
MAHVEALREFNRFYTRRIDVLRHDYLGSPFALPEARLVFEIGRAPGVSATTLGRDLGIDLGYLSRVLQGLKRRGYVQAKRTPEDARRSALTLTEKGRKAYALLNTRSRDKAVSMLEPLTAAQRAQLVGAMGTVSSLLSSKERISSEKEKKVITLRAHRPGDMGWVVERHAVLYHEQDGWGAPFEALIAQIVQEFLEKFDPERERCWIAEQNGERVGCVFVVQQNRTTAKLRLLLVEPNARGTGLGRRLVEECIVFARSKGYRKLVLWTHAHLAAARAIYRKTGFKKLRRTEVHDTFGPKAVSEFWEIKL